MPIAKERILYEDTWLLGVMKLSGELVVKGKGRVDRLPLLDFLRKEYPGLSPIHRLDFETSGVVIFAKSKNALKTIVESKFSGWIKTYVAIVKGLPKNEGVVKFPLPARSGDGKVAAETKYRLLKRLRDCSFVELTFERGQRHQIRRHMSMIGHPLVLDKVYGDERLNRVFSKYLKMQRFFLHASKAEFPHPVTKERITIECPLPKYFEATLRKLTINN